MLAAAIEVSTAEYAATVGFAVSVTLITAANEIDVRDVLPAIQVPTLVLHRRDELVSPVEAARYIAAAIPGAAVDRPVLAFEFARTPAHLDFIFGLPGQDQAQWERTHDEIVAKIRSFVARLTA